MAVAYKKLNWSVLVTYLLLVAFGWLNIYSSSIDEVRTGFDLSAKYGMHLIWIAITFGLGAAIMFFIPARIYTDISRPLYFFVCLLLVAVAFLGVEVNGS